MNIALVQYRPAIRLYKWAVTLKRLGHTVTVIHSRPPVPDLEWERFNFKRFVCCQPNHYDRWISFNANNEMSHPPECYTPVIQAVGDLSGVYGKYEKTERETLRKSHLNVYVSDAQRNWSHDNYGQRCDSAIIHNGVLSEMIGQPKVKTGGRVYSGTLSAAEHHNRNIITQLEQYPRVHIYPSSLGLPKGYTGSHLVIHETVKPYDLISELSQYNKGLILMQDPTIANMALPNKLYEYMAAGLTIEGTLSPEAEEIIDDDRIITYESQMQLINEIVNF